MLNIRGEQGSPCKTPHSTGTKKFCNFIIMSDTDHGVCVDVVNKIDYFFRNVMVLQG